MIQSNPDEQTACWLSRFTQDPEYQKVFGDCVSLHDSYLIGATWQSSRRALRLSFLLDTWNVPTLINLEKGHEVVWTLEFAGVEGVALELTGANDLCSESVVESEGQFRLEMWTCAGELLWVQFETAKPLGIEVLVDPDRNYCYLVED